MILFLYYFGLTLVFIGCNGAKSKFLCWILGVLRAGTESPAYDLEGPNGNVNSLLHSETIRDHTKVV